MCMCQLDKAKCPSLFYIIHMSEWCVITGTTDSLVLNGDWSAVPVLTRVQLLIKLLHVLILLISTKQWNLLIYSFCVHQFGRKKHNQLNNDHYVIFPSGTPGIITKSVSVHHGKGMYMSNLMHDWHCTVFPLYLLCPCKHSQVMTNKTVF